MLTTPTPKPRCYSLNLLYCLLKLFRSSFKINLLLLLINLIDYTYYSFPSLFILIFNYTHIKKLIHLDGPNSNYYYQILDDKILKIKNYYYYINLFILFFNLIFTLNKVLQDLCL